MRCVVDEAASLECSPELQHLAALRVSYGMNGILLRTEHLASLNSYMRYVLDAISEGWNVILSCSAGLPCASPMA